MIYKIWNLTEHEEMLRDTSSSPATLDYKTGLSVRLHPKYELVKGELVKVDYYQDFNEHVFSNKILCVDIEWTRDAQGTLLKRTETRRWTIEHDGEGDVFGPHTKVTEKFYDTKTAALADSRRRRNVVEDMTAQVDYMAAMFGKPELKSYVQTMFRSLDNELNAYEKTGDLKIIEKIGSYSGVWLDMEIQPSVTLRMAIMGALAL